MALNGYIKVFIRAYTDNAPLVPEFRFNGNTRIRMSQLHPSLWYTFYRVFHNNETSRTIFEEQFNNQIIVQDGLIEDLVENHRNLHIVTYGLLQPRDKLI